MMGESANPTSHGALNPTAFCKALFWVEIQKRSSPSWTNKFTLIPSETQSTGELFTLPAPGSLMAIPWPWERPACKCGDIMNQVKATFDKRIACNKGNVANTEDKCSKKDKRNEMEAKKNGQQREWKTPLKSKKKVTKGRIVNGRLEHRIDRTCNETGCWQWRSVSRAIQVREFYQTELNLIQQNPQSNILQQRNQ